MVLAAVVTYWPRFWNMQWRGRPIFGIKIQPDTRDWKLISVRHEEKFNDIRAILGNDIAIKAYREGHAIFPGWCCIARLSWNY